MARPRGFSLVSLIVGMGIAAAVLALVARCLVLTGGSIAKAERDSSTLLERFRAGDFASSLLSWSGCGEAGSGTSLETDASGIRLTVRPSIDGPEATVWLTLEEGVLAIRRDDGRRWTVIRGCPPGPITVGDAGLVTVPLGEGLDSIAAAAPVIDRPLAWRGP